MSNTKQNTMKTTEFIARYKPCQDGQTFAEKFETMSEVWEACQRPDWLFWILKKHKPLEKVQSVRLAIAFAEASLSNWNLEDDRPAKAIQAAKDWLENPCEETVLAAQSAAESAARAAADSAESAARAAAESAARAAADSAAWSAAESAADSARSAAWSAAWSARLEQSNEIRRIIENPFILS